MVREPTGQTPNTLSFSFSLFKKKKKKDLKEIRIALTTMFGLTGTFISKQLSRKITHSEDGFYLTSILPYEHIQSTEALTHCSTFINPYQAKAASF